MFVFKNRDNEAYGNVFFAKQPLTPHTRPLHSTPLHSQQLKSVKFNTPLSRKWKAHLFGGGDVDVCACVCSCASFLLFGIQETTATETK